MITKMESKKRCSSAQERDGGGGWGVSLPGAAQGCWRRVCETKHDASEAEAPSSMAKEKRVESLRVGGGGGERLRIHWLALNQTKSKFLRVLSLRCNRVNGLEISELTESS